MSNIKEIDLKITPVRTGDTVTDWELEIVGTNQKGKSGSYPKVGLKKDSSRHQFNIEITDPLDQVEFPRLIEDALWVAEVPTINAGSPTSKGIKSDQIKDPTRLNDTQISFIDKNNGQERILSYQLNFADGVKSLDPIIENGGGTGPGMFPPKHFVAYAGGAALLIAIVFFFLGRAYQKSLK